LLNYLWFLKVFAFGTRIVVNRDLRERCADGELAMSNRTISEARFHPYRVFKALGLTDEGKILETYLNAFAGNRTFLFEKRNNIYASALFDRIGKFYLGTKKPVGGMYDILNRAGYFDEFITRFCRHDGIPSLLPDDLLNMDTAKNPMDYLKKFRVKGFKFIEQISSTNMERVRIRRSIQARAYYALCLRYVFENNLIVWRKRIKSETHKSLVTNIEIYLSALEEIVIKLARGDSIKKINLERHNIDDFFEKKIRQPLLRGEAWLSERRILLPYLNAPDARFGILNKSFEINRLTRQNLTRKASVFAAKALKIPTGDPSQVRLAKRFARFSEVSSMQNKKINNNLTWQRSFNKLIFDPLMLPLWSVPLWGIDPVKNNFREILFAYY
jgi:hypothetical protein